MQFEDFLTSKKGDPQHNPTVTVTYKSSREHEFKACAGS